MMLPLSIGFFDKENAICINHWVIILTTDLLSNTLFRKLDSPVILLSRIQWGMLRSGKCAE